MTDVEPTVPAGSTVDVKLSLRSATVDGPAGAVDGGTSAANSGGCEDDWLPLLVWFLLALMFACLLCCCCLAPFWWWPKDRHVMVVDLMLNQGAATLSIDSIDEVAQGTCVF